MDQRGRQGADIRSPYDEDFVAWTKEQAEALRAAAQDGTNQALDWENLAEEIESLGASERRELHSQIQRIIRHLLKLENSPARDPRPGWVETIDDARGEIELVLEASPSLKREVGEIIEAELARGSRRAVRDLEKYGELDSAVVSRIRAARYTEDQVLGDWFPPDPDGTGKD
ncbi:MAG: DUF29 domain-containing protein [Alphaproteobacteria bacterium]